MINPTENAIPSEVSLTAEMHIDEESRPRFPPSTQMVIAYEYPAHLDILKAPDKKNNYPSTSTYSPPSQLGKNLSSPRRTSPAPSPHEYQNQTSRNTNK